MTDYHGEERRTSGVTREDVAALSEQVSDLDNTIRTLFLTKADAHDIFPNWQQLEARLRTVETSQKTERKKETKRLVKAMLVGFLLWTPFAGYLFVQVQDAHMEACGPAHRPTTEDQKHRCDIWSIGHDHPLQADADAELADRLLRSLGIDPAVVRRYASTTTTTVP